MAIYFNLGVDCGHDESVADLVMAHFTAFQVDLANLAPVEFRLSREFARTRWYVGVCPAGLSHASPMGDRPEICNDTTQKIIEDAVLDHISKISGYRRAHFGGECFDRLARADDEEDQHIDYVGLVFSIAEFGQYPPALIVEDFSPGYKRVVETKLEQRIAYDGDPTVGGDLAAYEFYIAMALAWQCDDCGVRHDAARDIRDKEQDAPEGIWARRKAREAMQRGWFVLPLSKEGTLLDTPCYCPACADKRKLKRNQPEPPL